MNSNLILHTNKLTLDNIVNGMYICDLHSSVLKNAKEDNVFITIMNNINSIAVAVMVDLPCVIITQGSIPTTDMIKRANEENITLMSTKLNNAEIAFILKDMGL